MTFSGKIKVSIALLMAVGSCAMAAKSTTGKVVDKLGDAKWQKSTKIGQWEDINVGNRIKEKDQVRTGIESHVALALSDGSSITIQENSLVEFTTLEVENGIQTALTDVKTGKVKFDAQKQHSGGSFKFKTATATAAIRGTGGFFGTTPGKRAALLSLISGNGIIRSVDGLECEVNGGQTGFIREGAKSCNVIDAKSSGYDNYVKDLENLLDDLKKTEEELQKALHEIDSIAQVEIENAKEKILCKIEPLEDTITVNSVNIKGSCPEGVKVSISGTTVKDASAFDIQMSWAPSSGGEKKFNVISTADVEVPCPPQLKKGKKSQTCTKAVSVDNGTFKTFYKTADQEAAPDTTFQDTTTVDSVVAKPFAVTTPSLVEVCDPGSVTIEGTFDQTDPNGTLYVKMGTYKSRNLVPLSANGEFSHTITINDVLRNWNETKVTVEYHGKNLSDSKDVELSVNKACKQVNQLRPTVTFIGSDSVKCLASFSLVGATDDLVYMTREVDGGNAKGATFTKNTIYPAQLVPGLHTYTLQAEDQAGNKSTLKKTLGCYPMRIPRVEIAGPAVEPLRPPPPPPRTSLIIHRTMRFRIAGVTQQDPIHIKHIKVVQDNSTLLDISGSQITDLDYDIQVELARSSTSVIKVFVEMKNGKKIFGTKTYEVN